VSAVNTSEITRVRLMRKEIVSCLPHGRMITGYSKFLDQLTNDAVRFELIAADRSYPPSAGRSDERRGTAKRRYPSVSEAAFAPHSTVTETLWTARLRLKDPSRIVPDWFIPRCGEGL